MASYLPATLVTLKLMLKLTFMYIVGQLLPLKYKRAMAIQEQSNIKLTEIIKSPPGN